MPRHTSENTCGYCPESQDNQDIEVSFVEISASGMQGWKKIDFSCSYEEDHGCSDPKHCPIYLSAPYPR